MPVKRVKIRKTVRKVDAPQQRTGVKRKKSSSKTAEAAKLSIIKKTKSVKRVTARKTRQKTIKTRASKRRAAATKRAKAVGRKKTVKAPKKKAASTITTASKVTKAKSGLKRRKDKLKAKQEFEKGQKQGILREKAQITRQINGIRTQQRRGNLRRVNRQKTNESKRSLAEENTRQISTDMSLTATPASRASERKAAADTMNNTLDSGAKQLTSLKDTSQGLTAAIPRETISAANSKTNASRTEPSIETTKRSLESQDAARNTVIKTLEPVSPAKLYSQRTKADHAGAAKNDALNSNTGMQTAATNVGAAKNRGKAANEGLGAEGGNGKRYADAEGNARNGGDAVKASKADAARKQAETVTGDIGAAKAKRNKREKDAGDAQKGVTKAADDTTAATKTRKDTEENNAANDKDITTREGNQKSAADDMNAGVTAHRKQQQEVDGINQAKAKATAEHNALGKNAEAQRSAADAIRPDKSPAHMAKQKDRDAIQGKIDKVKADHDAAVTRLETTITTRSGFFSSNKSHDVVVAKNKADSDNASSKISEGTRRQATEKGTHDAHTIKEGTFKSKSQEQTARANKKAETIDALKKTNEIAHGSPQTKGAAPNPLKAEGNIRAASEKAAVSSGVRSHADDVKQKMDDIKSKEDAAKDTLDAESTRLDAHKKALSDEQAQAKNLKEKGDSLDGDINARQNEGSSLDGAVKKQKDTANSLDDSMKPARARRQEHEGGANKADESARKAKEDADSAASAKARGEDAMKNSKAQMDAEGVNGNAHKQAEADAAKSKQSEQDKRAAAEKAGQEKATGDVNAARAKKQELQEKLMDVPTKKDNDKATADVDAAQKDRDANDADIERSKAKKEEAEDALNNAEETHNLNKKIEADLVKAHADIEGNIKNLEQQIKKAEADADSYFPHSSAKREKLRGKVEELRSTLDGVKQRKNEIEADIAAKRAERDEIGALTKERDTLRGERSKLESDLNKNNKEIEDIDAQIKANNQKTPPNKELDATLQKRKADLEAENNAIRDRLDQIKSRLHDIDGEFENRRARDKLDDAARRKRDEDDFYAKVRKDSEIFDAQALKRTNRLNNMSGILGYVASVLTQHFLDTMLPRPGPDFPFDPANMDIADQLDLSGQTVFDPNAASGATSFIPLKGNVQTCYSGICTIQNLFCSKGSSEYLRGCKDGTSAGTTDGKNDGGKDQKQHQNNILPLSPDQIAAAVAIDMAGFTEIEKEAYCQQVENEARNAGMTLAEFYTLYPECKVPSKYGAPPLAKPYGEKAYGEKEYGEEGYGQEGGAPEASSSSDYLLGYTESYRKAYMQSYTNGWALSKLNANDVIPIVMKPAVLPNPVKPYGESKYGEPKYGSVKGGKISSSQLKKVVGKTIQRLALTKTASQQ